MNTKHQMVATSGSTVVVVLLNLSFSEKKLFDEQVTCFTTTKVTSRGLYLLEVVITGHAIGYMDLL